MGRLNQICGFDSQTATTEHSSTEHHPSGWIDYDQAEAALFAEFLGPDGYGRVLAKDHARHFGADIDKPEVVEDLAGMLYPKAAEILNQHGTRRAFSDRHLWAKCHEWAEWWCEFHAKGHRKYPHTKYSPESAALGFERGLKRGNAKKANAADIRALLVQLHHAEGRTVRQIAELLDIAKSTAGDALHRSVGVLRALVCWLVRHGKESLRTQLEFSFGPVQNDLPSRTPSPIRPEPPPEPPPDTEIAADPAHRAALGALCSTLRQRLSQVLLSPAP